MTEAQLEETESGLRPMGGGWFVVNARDAAWAVGDPFGACRLVFGISWRSPIAPRSSEDASPLAGRVGRALALATCQMG